ncbi:hypothetical protein ABB37_07579 [Leptomonas pyrrhocoris]|uniref:Uncharacterized protein n=1 Tax=Leptomonas pyrrhocoris TaxID=157538 RepID=A0A0N0VDX2_LEPPY|nr:hypothetical protein ABB37_07579 [Leptomonas pyrrhocoris]KPA76752.1 hypothetical protein ABB37_07579 [Leptomonas pyrrhocoris]|eukprot:XP_015655191.1 hypothetical protein ABB37_07579 [Leptomonas pyrrhocoris]
MPSPVNANDAPSLSVATLPRKAVVMGFGTKLIIGRYPLDDAVAPSPYNSVLVDDGQLVRAVEFLQIPDGPLCVVSAGDSKLINVYNVSSWKQNNPLAAEASSDDDDRGNKNGSDAAVHVSEVDILDGEARRAAATKVPSSAKANKALTTAEYWKPSYQYGPHTKRITSLATCAEGSVIFADKFGEVYRLRLSWSPSHTIEVDGDAAKPATFLLQHFSILSTMFLTSPIPRIEAVAASEDRSGVACRRLFTCDKDRHARVSRYPETYVIDQFLWTRTSVQSVVTCVAEVVYMEDAAVYDPMYNVTAERVNKHNKAFNAPFSYYVTGTHAGDVHFWAAMNTIPMESNKESFHLISTFRPRLAGGALEELGAVVGITVLTSGTDRFGYPRHPRDTPRGVLVAYERCCDVFFIPLYDNMGAYALHPALVAATRTTLEALPVAMVSSNDATAFVLKRDGSVSFVCLCDVPPPATGSPAKTCSFNANIHVELRETDVKMPYLEERIRAVMGGPASASSGASGEKQTALEALDLSAPWRYEAVDPRTRKHGDDKDDSKESESDEEGEAKSQGKKGNGNAKKKARVDAS